jgi:hypothetical protein
LPKLDVHHHTSTATATATVTASTDTPSITFAYSRHDAKITGFASSEKPHETKL